MMLARKAMLPTRGPRPLRGGCSRDPVCGLLEGVRNKRVGNEPWLG